MLERTIADATLIALLATIFGPLTLPPALAVMAAMLAAGLGLRDAVALANRAGGIVVGKLGTATVNYDELFSGGSE